VRVQRHELRLGESVLSKIFQVYDAYRQGSRTTREVCDFTGQRIDKVASYTNKLIVRGLIAKRGNAMRWSKFGNHPGFFEPVQPPVAWRPWIEARGSAWSRMPGLNRLHLSVQLSNATR
jgi:hypothetical protein